MPKSGLAPGEEYWSEMQQKQQRYVRAKDKQIGGLQYTDARAGRLLDYQ